MPNLADLIAQTPTESDMSSPQVVPGVRGAARFNDLVASVPAEAPESVPTSIRAAGVLVPPALLALSRKLDMDRQVNANAIMPRADGSARFNEFLDPSSASGFMEGPREIGRAVTHSLLTDIPRWTEGVLNTITNLPVGVSGESLSGVAGIQGGDLQAAYADPMHSAALGLADEPWTPLGQSARGAIGMAPLLAAGAIDPSLVPFVFGAQSTGDVFNAAIARGRTPEQAAQEASAAGMMNTAVGATPMGFGGPTLPARMIGSGLGLAGMDALGRGATGITGQTIGQNPEALSQAYEDYPGSIPGTFLMGSVLPLLHEVPRTLRPRGEGPTPQPPAPGPAEASARPGENATHPTPDVGAARSQDQPGTADTSLSSIVNNPNVDNTASESQPVTSPRRRAKGTPAEDASNLQAFLRQKFVGASVVVEPTLSVAEAAAVRVIRRLTGADASVVRVSGDGDVFKGAYSESGRLLLRQGMDATQLSQKVGHELVHAFRNSAADLWRQWVNAVGTLAPDHLVSEWADKARRAIAAYEPHKLTGFDADAEHLRTDETAARAMEWALESAANRLRLGIDTGLWTKIKAWMHDRLVRAGVRGEHPLREALDAMLDNAPSEPVPGDTAGQAARLAAQGATNGKEGQRQGREGLLSRIRRGVSEAIMPSDSTTQHSPTPPPVSARPARGDSVPTQAKTYSGSGGGAPNAVTRDMRQQLVGMGWSRGQVAKMRPAEALDHIRARRGPGVEVSRPRGDGDVPTAPTEKPTAGTPFPETGTPKHEPAMGDADEIHLKSGRRVKVQHAVMDAGDVVPTHDPLKGFVPNPAGDYNERAYEHPEEGRASRSTVEEITQNPTAGRIINSDDPTPTNGPSIVTRGRQVLGGNARAMAAQLIYSRGGEAAQRFRDATIKAAKARGIDPEALAKIPNPVPVRIVTENPGTRGEMSRILNDALTTAKPQTTDYVSRGKKLTPSDLERLDNAIGDRTVSDALDDPNAAASIVQTMVDSGAWSKDDLVALRENDGKLTDAGRRTIEGTLMGAAMGDVGAMHSASPNTRKNIARAVRQITRLRVIAPDLDVPTRMKNALAALVEYRNAKDSAGVRSFEDFLRHEAMVHEPWRDDLRGIALAYAIENDGPIKFQNRMKEIVEGAEMSAGGQQGLGLGGPSSPADAWDAVLAKDSEVGRKVRYSLDDPEREVDLWGRPIIGRISARTAELFPGFKVSKPAAEEPKGGLLTEPTASSRPTEPAAGGGSGEASGTVAAQPAKEPWQMTRKQYKASQGLPTFGIGLDHSTLSPNGRVSKRQQEANRKRMQERLAEITRAEQSHEASVRDAIASGRPVPPEVLKDYPDLVLDAGKKVEAAQPAKEPWQMTRDDLGPISTFDPVPADAKFRGHLEDRQGNTVGNVVQTAPGVYRVLRPKDYGKPGEYSGELPGGPFRADQFTKWRTDQVSGSQSVPVFRFIGPPSPKEAALDLVPDAGKKIEDFAAGLRQLQKDHGKMYPPGDAVRKLAVQSSTESLLSVYAWSLKQHADVQRWIGAEAKNELRSRGKLPDSWVSIDSAPDVTVEPFTVGRYNGQMSYETLAALASKPAKDAREIARKEMGQEELNQVYPGIRRGESVADYELRIGTAATPDMFAGRFSMKDPRVEEEHVDPKDIVNPIPRDVSDVQKAGALRRLSNENRPLVERLMHSIDSALRSRGESKASFKAMDKMIAKFNRPSILAEKPWHGGEHLRDAYRFKTSIDDFRDIPKILDIVQRHGFRMVKLDTKKLFNPKEWGWRFVAFDLRAPNGQLIEYYMPFRELEQGSKHDNHLLFEKWRNLSTDAIVSSGRVEDYKADVRKSFDAYTVDFSRALKRLGLDDAKARASWSQVEDLLRSKTGSKLSRSSSGDGKPSNQEPLPSDIAVNPEDRSSTYTRPESGSINATGRLEGSSSTPKDRPGTDSGVSTAKPIGEKSGSGESPADMGPRFSLAPPDDVKRNYDRAQEEIRTGADRTVGRPELANPVDPALEGGRARVLMDAVDQARKDAGVPQPRSQADVHAEAERIYQADPKGERDRLVAAARAGTTPTDLDTAIARRVLAAGLVDAVKNLGDPAELAKHLEVAAAYRKQGTETARALAIRTDPHMTPAERMKAYLSEVIGTPTGSIGGRLEAANELLAQGWDRVHKIRDSLAKDDPMREAIDRALDHLAKTGEIQLTEGSATGLPHDFYPALTKLQRALDKQRRIVGAWSEKVGKINERLKAIGIDPANITDDAILDPRTSAAIGRAISTTLSPWNDRLYELWINGLLSHPKTHIANALSNTSYAAMGEMPTRLLEMTQNLLTGNHIKGAPTFGEVPMMFRQIMPAFRNAGRNMVLAWSTEMPQLERQIQAAGGNVQAAAKVPLNAAIPGKAGRVIRTPGRALVAADEANKQFLSTIEAGAAAYRIAHGEGLQGAKMEQRINELLNDQGSQAWAEAFGLARRATFQNDIGPFGNWIMRGKRDVPGFRWISPFIRVGANLFARGLERTPLEALKVGYDLAREGAYRIDFADGSEKARYTAKEFNRDLSLLAQGVGVTALLWWLHDQKDKDGHPIITGAGAGFGRGERDLEARLGDRPYTIRIGGRAIDYGRFEPIKTTLGTAIDVIDAWKKAPAGEEGQRAATRAAKSILAQVRDTTFLKGLGDIITAIEDPGANGEKVLRWGSQFAASWVPNIVRGSLSAGQGYAQDRDIRPSDDQGVIRSAMERTAQAALPGVVPSAPPKVNLWGDTVGLATFPKPMTDWLYRMFVPIRTSETSAPFFADRLILNWNNKAEADPTGTLEPFLPVPPSHRLDIPGGKPYAMNEQEYHDYAERAGRLAKQYLMDYQDRLNVDAPTLEDITVVRRIIERSRDAARREMLGKILERKAIRSGDQPAPAGTGPR